MRLTPNAGPGLSGDPLLVIPELVKDVAQGHSAKAKGTGAAATAFSPDGPREAAQKLS